MDINQTKKELRQKMLAARNSFSETQKTIEEKLICEQLIDLVKGHNYQVVHTYLPMGNEVDVSSFIKYCLNNSIKVIAPKTLPNRQLEHLVLTGLNDVEKGVFGTTHPNSSQVYKGQIDLIVVPGLVVDKNNYRLGYGGGYYDTFINDHNDALTVGVFFSFQLVDEVPTEPHDVRLKKVLLKT